MEKSKLWNNRFLDIASTVAGWSKDPSTKCGAVIVREDRTIASLGYNGFPRFVVDSSDRLHARDSKLAMTVHAELNAILNAREPLHNCTLFVRPLPPCAHCAAAIIQTGISSVVYSGATPDRWAENMELARVMLAEAGVSLHREVGYSVEEAA